MKKKLLIAVLASVMTLSACGQSGEPKKLETISASAQEVKNARTDAAKEDEPADTDESQAQEQGTGSEEYERGVITENAWESTFWNLRFTPPEGLSMLSEEELNNMMGLGEEFLSENFSEKQVEYAQMMNVYEMMSSNLSGDANVVVTAEKLLASGFLAEDYLKATKRTLTSVTTISYTVLEEGGSFQIGDDTYGVMKVMGEGNGMVIYQDFYAKVNGNRALAIAVTYTDDTFEIADEIINGFEAL